MSALQFWAALIAGSIAGTAIGIAVARRWLP